MNLYNKHLAQLAFLLLFIVPGITVAQDNLGVRGRVVDTENKPIVIGNVLILSATDSSLVKGGLCEDGNFSILGLNYGSFILKIDALGYQPYFKPFALTESLPTNPYDLGQTILDNTQLKEVVVTSRAMLFKREMDKLTVNVAETLLSNKGTAVDVLKSAPNVIVKSNGLVEVFGRGQALIYLDNQLISSTELLNSISSNDIQTIEIIENPSSRYDAAGNAVIKIITKRAQYEGYEGTLYLWPSYRTFGFLYSGLVIKYKKKKFSLYAAAAVQTGKFRFEEDYRRQLNQSPRITMDNDVVTDRQHKLDQGYIFKADYLLDSLSTISLNANGNVLNRKESITNTNFLKENDLAAGSINSFTLGKPLSTRLSLSSNYFRTLDTLGSEFTVSGQFTQFDAENINDIRQTTAFGNNEQQSQFRNNSRNTINIASFQPDYKKVFSKAFVLDAGLKGSRIFNSSAINFERREGDNWIADSSLINDFDYDENIMAGYCQFSGKRSAINYLLGVRGEWTKTEGFSNIQNLRVIDRKYHNFFPSAQLGYNVSSDMNIGLSYFNRINRPVYQDLDPFVNFVDSLSSFRGNPFLLPAYSHTLEAKLIYMEYASVSIGYIKRKSPIHLVVEQNNDGTNSFSAIMKNIESSESFFAGLVLPYELSWWTTFNSFGYSTNSAKYKDNGMVINNNKPSFYVNLYNEFRIPKWFSTEVTYEYVSPGVDGFFLLNPYQSLSLNFKKSFWDGKLDCQLSFNDIFFTEIESGESTVQNFNVAYDSKSDTRTIQLSLQWNFGKLKKSGELKGKAIDTPESDRIKKD